MASFFSCADTVEFSKEMRSAYQLKKLRDAQTKYLGLPYM